MTLLAFSALAPSAGAADNPTTFSGNLSCGDLGLAGLKIDAQPSNGTYAAGAQGVATEGELPDGLEISISGVVHDDEAKTVTFSWSATVDDGDDADDERDAFFIDAVLVKFADGGLRWDYDQPGAAADTAWATQDSISHVSFCISGGVGGTDGTTDGGTTTGGTTTGGTTTGGTTDGTTTGGTGGTTDGTTTGGATGGTTTGGTTDGGTTTGGTTDGTTTGGTTTGGTTTDGATDGDTTGVDVLDSTIDRGTSGSDTDGVGAGTSVLGSTVTRGSTTSGDTLPRTGSEDTSLAIAGAGLIALGAAGLVAGNTLARRRRGAHFA